MPDEEWIKKLVDRKVKFSYQELPETEHSSPRSLKGMKWSIRSF